MDLATLDVLKFFAFINVEIVLKKRDVFIFKAMISLLRIFILKLFQNWF